MAKEEQKEFREKESSLISFEPTVVIYDVVRHWLVILVVALAIGVGAYILTDLSYSPVYQSSATLVVTTRDSSATVYSNLSSTTSLAAVFDEILNSSVFRRIIQEEAGITDFSGQIKANAAADTNLLIVTVSDSDPRTAFLMIRAILQNHQIPLIFCLFVSFADTIVGNTAGPVPGHIHIHRLSNRGINSRKKSFAIICNSSHSDSPVLFMRVWFYKHSVPCVNCTIIAYKQTAIPQIILSYFNHFSCTARYSCL